MPLAVCLKVPFLLDYELGCLDTLTRLPWSRVLESLGFVSLALSRIVNGLPCPGQWYIHVAVVLTWAV